MELLLVIGVIALLYYFLSNRKREKITHEITRVQTFKDGKNSYLQQAKTTITEEKTSSVTNRAHCKTIKSPSNITSSINSHCRANNTQNDVVRTQKKLSTLNTNRGSLNKPELSKKLCKNCKTQKQLSEFRLNSNTEDGYTKYCNTCMDSKPRKNIYLRCPKCGKNRKKSSFFESKKVGREYSKWCKFCHR